MSSASRIKVMVVDDHPIMRNGLRDTLEASGRFEVVGLAEDGDEALRTVEGLQPQVIVMDVIMPNKDGIYRIQDKLGIRSKQELVIWAVRNDLVNDVAVGRDSQPVTGES